MYNKESLTYSDVEKKLELDIFGIKYNVDVTDKMLKEFEEMSKSNEDDVELGKKAIDMVLGEGQYELLKNKYEADTKKEFGVLVLTKIIFYIAGRIENFYKDENEAVNKYQEKYQNRNFRRNNRRNNYRRY